jgi:hypothetical protein
MVSDEEEEAKPGYHASTLVMAKSTMIFLRLLIDDCKLLDKS